MSRALRITKAKNYSVDLSRNMGVCQIFGSVGVDDPSGPPTKALVTALGMLVKLSSL